MIFQSFSTKLFHKGTSTMASTTRLYANVTAASNVKAHRLQGKVAIVTASTEG